MKAGKLEPFDAERIRPHPIKLEGRRFVVMVDVSRRPRRSVRLVIKGYWDDRAGQVYENHRRLWDSGLGTERAIRTARPWGVLDGLGAIVMERLPGKPADPADKAAAARKGEATALLHSCTTTLTPAMDLDSVLKELGKNVSRLEQSEPELARGALELAEQARALEPMMRTSHYTPVHGDLSHSNFLFSRGRVRLFDWDQSCQFDPAFDVGYQLSQLQRAQLRLSTDLADARERFLRAYLEATGEPELERRIRYFETIVSLSKASLVSRRSRPGWQVVVPGLLRSADEGLKQIA